MERQIHQEQRREILRREIERQVEKLALLKKLQLETQNQLCEKEEESQKLESMVEENRVDSSR